VLAQDALWQAGAAACAALDAEARKALEVKEPAWVAAHTGGAPAPIVLAFFPTAIQITPFVELDLASAAAALGGVRATSEGSLAAPEAPWTELFRGSARWALAVALAKLDLIEGAGRALVAAHSADQNAERPQPLLVPTSDRFAVRWNGQECDVRLRDPGTPMRFRPHGIPRTVALRHMLPVPSPEAPRLLVPEGVGPAEFATELQVVLRPGDAGDDGQRVDLQADRDPLPGAAAGDLVRVTPAGDQRGDDLWLRVLEADRRRARLVLLHGDLGADGGREERVSATFYRRYGTDCDLRAFGLCAAEVLFGNDERGGLDVQEALLAAGPTPDPDSIEFSPLNVLHRRADRTAVAQAMDAPTDRLPPGHVPPGQWARLLRVLARSVHASGRPGERQDEDPWQRLLDTVADVRDRLRVELFRREERDFELGQICELVAVELREGMVGGAP
jgi:hypothetical protein